MTTPRLDSQPPSLDQMAQALKAAGWTRVFGNHVWIPPERNVWVSTETAYAEMQRRQAAPPAQEPASAWEQMADRVDASERHRALRDAAADDEAAPETCEQTEDSDGNWHTSCGELRVLTVGTPSENKLKWCGCCGLRLVEVAHTEDEK